MRLATVLAVSVIGCLAPNLVSAQSGDPQDGGATVADVPFGVGERLRFRVKFGPLQVGEAEMAVAGIDTVAGHPTYHLRFHLKGGTFFYKIDDTQESWLDVSLLASRRFHQNLNEGDYERDRTYEIDLEGRTYTSTDGQSDSIPPLALDDASFVYFIRTVGLEPGRTYEWNRYFRYDRNPVILRVLRRETVDVPAGEFRTVVVRPIIKAGGIYSEGGRAEVYLTDDERRIPVHLKTHLKVGTLTLDLIEYEAGTRLSLE